MDMEMKEFLVNQGVILVLIYRYRLLFSKKKRVERF